MIDMKNEIEPIVIGIVCGCLFAIAFNSLKISKDIARIEAHLDSTSQMMCYCMTNRTTEAMR